MCQDSVGSDLWMHCLVKPWHDRSCAVSLTEQVGDKVANPTMQHVASWKYLSIIWHPLLFTCYYRSYCLPITYFVHPYSPFNMLFMSYCSLREWVLLRYSCLFCQKAGILGKAANPCPPYLYLEDTSPGSLSGSRLSGLWNLGEKGLKTLTLHMKGKKQTPWTYLSQIEALCLGQLRVLWHYVPGWNYQMCKKFSLLMSDASEEKQPGKHLLN